MALRRIRVCIECQYRPGWFERLFNMPTWWKCQNPAAYRKLHTAPVIVAQPTDVLRPNFCDLVNHDGNCPHFEAKEK